MAIKLKLNEASYALYDEESDQFVYGGNHDFSFGLVPKSSGMFQTVEKVKARHDRLLASLEESSQQATFENPHYDRFECGKPGPLANVSKEQLAKIVANNAVWQREAFRERLETAKKFIIVKIGVTAI